MASFIDKLFPRKIAYRPKAKKNFSGMYDSSWVTHARPFLGYWSTDAKYQVSNYDLMRLRSNSRKLFANLGVIRAPILQRTEYAFGATGWRPVFTGTDKAWGNTATNLLESDILPNIDVRGPMFAFGEGLALANTDMDRDGDILILFTEDEEGLPRIQYVPAHRIGQRSNTLVLENGPYAGCEIHHGVISLYDTPVAYQIIGHTAEEDFIVSTDDAILVFKPEINGFPRGIPLPSFALNALEDMMVMKVYEQQALMLSGQYGLVETNPEGAPEDLEGAIQSANFEASWDPIQTPQGPVPAHTLPPIQTREALGGLIKFIKSNTGSKFEVLKPEGPDADWDGFLDRLTREYCSGIPWPFELAWSGEKIGGANVRLVTGQAQRSVESRRTLFLNVAKRIIKYSVAKLIDLGELPESDDWDNWSFTYPPEITVDAGRDERARQDAYKLGILNLGEILTEQGKTLEHHVQQRVDEYVLREQLARIAEEKFGFKIDRNLLAAFFANPIAATGDGAAKETPAVVPEGTPAPAPAPDKEAIRQAVGPYLGWGTETEELTEKLSQVIKAE
jgi:hypothetical protein